MSEKNSSGLHLKNIILLKKLDLHFLVLVRGLLLPKQEVAAAILDFRGFNYCASIGVVNNVYKATFSFVAL